MLLNGLIPPGGFLVVTTIPGFDLENVSLLYLFRFDGTRVDQIGFHDAPPLGAEQCYARCPDGAHPYLGYNYVSSGGGISFLPRACTLGFTNGADCYVTGLPDPEDGNARPTDWGRIKHGFAR